MASTYSPYLLFERSAWHELKGDTLLLLSEDDIKKLQGRYESVSLKEVLEVYLPLSRLLNLYVKAVQNLFQVTSHFLNNPEPKVPYIIGISGSVAVGKSTTSKVLQALFLGSNLYRVEIITTDGFIYSNKILEQKKIMHRKGFPESYDLHKLISFLSALKAGKENLKVPIYSHHISDITTEVRIINQPDIVILEGLNILQHATVSSSLEQNQVFVTDYCDFTIYVDADTVTIKNWYLDRFMKFRALAANKPDVYLYQFTQMSDQEAFRQAENIWSTINELNLNENILPFRERAKLILYKGKDHSVEKIYLRKI